MRPPSTPSRGEALLAQVKAGSTDAFEHFYDLYVRYVFGIAMKMLKNKSDAEDLCHDVFLEIYRNPHSFDPQRGSIEAWIAVKTRSRCLDRLRRSKRMLVKEDVEEDLQKASTDHHLVEEQVITHSEHEEVRQALSALPEAQKAAIYGHYFEGHSHRELEHKLKRPLGTIKSLVRYGIQNMRRFYQEQRSFPKARGEKHDL
ncbi:sigma-70 family RNA polymerase sigma factor [Caldalkalibacillus salinus]|uniref:sigma-70 family RNA polymerase sigma factor n=1 Tax=Caldalkalibacillus salinus TaxID=2803787 RepID=UPI001EFF9F2E|nr:sigma-70 family RNA polymerase sigma factor [Caldalkalibacillus salinus]